MGKFIWEPKSLVFKLDRYNYTDSKFWSLLRKSDKVHYDSVDKTIIMKREHIYDVITQYINNYNIDVSEYSDNSIATIYKTFNNYTTIETFSFILEYNLDLSFIGNVGKKSDFKGNFTNIIFDLQDLSNVSSETLINFFTDIGLFNYEDLKNKTYLYADSMGLIYYCRNYVESMAYKEIGNEQDDENIIEDKSSSNEIPLSKIVPENYITIFENIDKLNIANQKINYYNFNLIIPIHF